MPFTAVFARLDREQREVIAFFREENRVLKAQPGRRRLRLNDDQRRRLAMRASGTYVVPSGSSSRTTSANGTTKGLGNELIHWWACQRRRVLWRPATNGWPAERLLWRCIECGRGGGLAQNTIKEER